MVDDMPDSPFFTLAPLEPEWQPILHAENQVVLYNPTSHALSIRQHVSTSQTAPLVRRLPPGKCPYCHRSLATDGVLDEQEEVNGAEFGPDDIYSGPRTRAPNYFQLLQVANEIGSVPSTPASSRHSRASTYFSEAESSGNTSERPFRAENMAEGYFQAFFQEECRLGMGANGSVYLCQHVLDGNPLGRFAVKKIAVGQSHAYLLSILREVRLLERLHHPNIVTYHHTWLETCQFSSFGPKVPTLHVLMQWAEGGSLDDFIDIRLGRTSASQLPPLNSSEVTSSSTHNTTPLESTDSDTFHSRSARIRAFRAFQHAPPEERERLRHEMAGPGIRGSGRSDRDWKAVHLFSAEEVKSLFKDVVEGLAFLHDKSILHLDLKPGNVLLTWDDGKLVPRAMLSDFGTSQDMLNSRTRSGNTGTLEYASPESLPSPTGLLAQVDSKSDMWSLGMILHKMLFFRLPYRHASDNPDKTKDSKRDDSQTAELLEKEVSTYPGFKSSPALQTAFDSRHLPRAFLVLLENLLHIRPATRPSCERVLSAIREGRLDPVASDTRPEASDKHSLVPIRRPSDVGPSSGPASSSSIEEVDLPRWIDNASEGVQTIDNDKRGELAPSSLPSPALPRRAPFIKLRLWNREFVILDGPEPRTLTIRTIKSALLVVKAWTIFSLSRDPSVVNHRVLALALGPAIADTWYDGLTASFFLGIVHIGLIRLATAMNH